MDASEQLSKNAAEFSATLNALAGSINADLSQVVRSTVLRLFARIIKLSPVDTGAYRGSHQIANREPDQKEGLLKSPYQPGQDPIAATSWADAKAAKKPVGWTWKPGDGSIWIFNNVPYAERLENGWSPQAPAGVYNVALAEIEALFQEQTKKSKYWSLT